MAKTYHWSVVYLNRWGNPVERWFGGKTYVDKYCANLDKHGIPYTVTEGWAK